MSLWLSIATIAALIFSVCVFGLLAPAHARVDLDTAAGQAMARVKLLWGVGPELKFGTAPRGQPRGRIAAVLVLLHDTPRIGHALLVAPKLLPVIKRLLMRLYRLRPRTSRIAISVNAAHPAANLALTAFGAVLNELPQRMRSGVSLTKRDSPGLDLSATLDLTASPLTLLSAYLDVREAPAMREFMRRLASPPANASANKK